MAQTNPNTVHLPQEPQLAAAESQCGVDFVALLNDAMKRIADLEAKVKTPSASRGKPGRKATNADIAAFANERRPETIWKAIYYAWKREHPDDPRNDTLTPERVRDAWRRHFGGKGKTHLLGRDQSKSRAN